MNEVTTEESPMGTVASIAWEAVWDTDEEQYIARGHHDKTPEAVSALADALVYERGGSRLDNLGDAQEAIFKHGYNGKVERFHDYVVCDENGYWHGVDDGEERATQVHPVTWALLPLAES